MPKGYFSALLVLLAVNWVIGWVVINAAIKVASLVHFGAS